MSFDVKNVNNFQVLTINESRLDATLSTAFKNYLFDFIEHNTIDKALVLDLSYIKFMDSSGLGAIVSGLKKLKDQNSMILIGIQPAVEDLFELTSMDKLFTIHNTLDDLVKA